VTKCAIPTFVVSTTKVLVDRGMGTIYLVNKTMIYNYNWTNCTLGSMLTSVWNESTKVLGDAYRVTSGGVAVFLDPTYCLKFLNLRNDTFESGCVNTTNFTYPWTQYGDMMLGMDVTNDDIFFQRLKFNNDISSVFLVVHSNLSMINLGQASSGTGFDGVSQNGKRYVTHEFSFAATIRRFKLAPDFENPTYIFPSTKASPSYQKDDIGLGILSGSGGLPALDFTYPPPNITNTSGTTSGTASGTTSGTATGTTTGTTSSTTSTTSSTTSSTQVTTSSSASTTTNSTNDSSRSFINMILIIACFIFSLMF